MSAQVPAAATRQPRRRWLQFSLRTLLVVMVLVAGAAAWVGNEIQKGRDQLVAIDWIEDQGGAVYFVEGQEPRWQQRWLGEWYPSPVKFINFSGQKVKDLAPLAALGETEALLWIDGSCESLDLSPLVGMKKLQLVELQGALPQNASLAVFREERPDVWITEGRPPWKEQVYEFSDGTQLNNDAFFQHSADDGVIANREGRLICYSRDRQRRWSLPLAQGAALLKTSFVELPDGDVVVYGYDAYTQVPGELVRIDPHTGTVRWRTSCEIFHSWSNTPCHIEYVLRKGDRLLVVCNQPGSRFVELLDIRSGANLYRWSYVRS